MGSIKRIFSLFLMVLTLTAYAEEFVAGTDYQVLSTAVEKPSATPTVKEFFSYGCPWCFRLEPSLEKWLTTHEQGIQFSRIPVVFNPEWEYYAKAYYVAHALGEDKKLTPLLFQAIVKNKQHLTSNQAMIDFFKAQGVNSGLVDSAFEHSLSVDMKIVEAKEAMQRDQILGVPAFVVNNHYKTDMQMAKSEERLYAILDYLIRKK